MRPVYPLSPTRKVPEHIPRPDYVAANGMQECSSLFALITGNPGKPLSEIQAAGQPPRILSAEEQVKMRTVCRVSYTFRS